MPKKKKNGHSGLAAQSEENISAHFNPGPNGSAAVTRDLSGSTMSQLSSQNREQIVRRMHDMFSHLDPDVIYIVLSEADFKVENAMDALLELSGAAERKTTTSPPLSGFAMAAALLESCPSPTKSSGIPAVSNDGESSQKLTEETHLTEEFDSLIDQELESLTIVQPPLSSITSSTLPRSYKSVPVVHTNSLPAQEALMELDVDRTSRSESLNKQSSFSKTSSAQRNASPINELSFGGESLPQKTGISVDFSHLTHDVTSATQRPSAFKAYRRPDRIPTQTSAPVSHSQSLHKFWNIQAPDFKACTERPAFITPIVQAPNPWTTIPMSLTQWMPSKPVSQAPLKPSATVPMSWILSPQRRLRLEGQVLVLLRGAPGSGKTTLASAMLEQNPGGVVLSTDEYFTQNSTYHYEPHLLGEAHAWNHQRAKEAFEKGLTPIIIDNTNLQCWEMKPYVTLAQKHNYRVLFREPNTWWKSKPRELEKRTKHGVPKEKIRRMLENQDRYVSVQNIMASQPKPTAVYGVDVCQTDLTEQPLTSCPDLVGDPGFGKPGRYLSSSLPDVSSVDCKSGSTSANTDSAENNFESYGSKEYVSSQEDVTEQIEAPQADLVDGADFELDACIERTLEQPVVYAESISQRVKRVREHTRIGSDAGTYCDTETGPLKALNSAGNRVGSLHLRLRDTRVRKRRRLKKMQLKSDSEFIGHLKSDTSNKTEFQKLLDLLQGDNNQITQETTLDFLPLAEDRKHSGLGTKAQPALPDCVLDWKSEISSEPENAQNSSPIKQLETRLSESSKRCTIEACADEYKPANKVVGLEQEDKPNSIVHSSPSPAGEVGCGSESSQEKKKVPSRRAGKSCKLALTFTHQSPLSSPQAGSLVTPLQQSEVNLSPVMSFTTCPSVSAQTEPQDFALLWRINQQKSSEPESGSCTREEVILEGDALRFVPKINKEKTNEQHVIPYRVCHEKGSQVEENDLTELPLRGNHSLEIIKRHFKHVPKETLEDLYEKCYQDIEWTTNLLLDSGEHLSKEDEEDDFGYQDVEGYHLVLGAKEKSCDGQVTGEPEVNVKKDMVIEETGSNYLAVIVPNDTNSTMSIDEELEVINAQIIQHSEHQPEVLDDMDHDNDPVEENKAFRDNLEVSEEFEVFEQHPYEELKGEVEKNRETEGEVNITMLSPLEEMEYMKEELRKEKEKEKRRQRKNGPINIQTLELKLTTELALQLTELFGPVGISPGGEFSPENCSVLMDLNLAKLLHQKWKETIQEKHRQAALSYHLLPESSVSWGESQPAAAFSDFLIGTESSFSSQSAFQDALPFMDHWNVSRPPISLRDIMLEEQVLQDSLEKSRESRWDLDKKDGAAIVKEKQLFALFPTIDRHFLRDIFRDNNYSLEQTEQFLHTLMDDEPVRTVVASESVPEKNEKCRATSRERKQKNEMDSAQFQDMEDPEYEDFRTEALLQRGRQQECFDKAAEAYRQGRKDVASFYAQQIFERVNSTLLPQNVLDLHGLHVNEALQHLQQVLAKKTSEWQQGLCRPQLSVITGRGNRSQGGVARIRPAVLDYLRSQHYKYITVQHTHTHTHNK
ncbi:NEDD4-binding protein 2 [Bagarius yarrelli]|uniref:NEDD4-binding protein 2 n=1 Tax=Bagarius yarrelli TaxID=175774 RepID=A0A556UFX6_BAGYA|nr:NEDD4-binding protein 2 [Bagarius yarrelli]